MIILFYRGLAYLFLMTLKFQALSAGTVFDKPIVLKKAIWKTSIELAHARESKTLFDSGFHISDSRNWILEFFSVELGFQIPIINGIPDFFKCIPGSKAQDSGFHDLNFPDYGFHRQKFIRFQNPDSVTWGEFN